jgi:glycosyltransferase involved in cell wall biosynthesis
MRLLHIGSGFRPWRSGGLVAYVEDLIDEQVRRGHDVAYFFSGRQYPLGGRPRLRRWERRGVPMLEVVNSPLFDHGRQPELESSEPRIEAMLERVLRELRPEAAHVHELAGLPFSLLDVIHAAGLPVVFTLQDYFPLCSTFKLLDADGRTCLRREIGEDCMASVAADARPPDMLIDATVKFDLWRAPVLPKLDTARVNRFIRRTSRTLAPLEAKRRKTLRRDVVTPNAFQRRRELNVERLNRVDRLIAMSHRVAEIYQLLGVDSARLRTIHLTLAHIEKLRPRTPSLGLPITFATLAGFESAAKGAHVLIDAARELSKRLPRGSYRLLVLGTVEPQFVNEVADIPGIEIRGRFAATELDGILDDVDVGIVPSVWEEAYGYAGVEFLAKGIPVIANEIGGMPDYTRDGETGWLNRSCSAEELARIMTGVVEHPQQVAELNGKLRARRDSVVKPMARHADEMDQVYHEVLASLAR